MPATPAKPGRLAPAWRAGVLASLAWVGAIGLGLPQAAGVPTLILVPVALVVGTLIGLTRIAWFTDVAAALVLGVTLLVAFTPLLRPRVQSLIESEPVPPGGADAVVVLSGAVSRDSLLSPDAAERLLHAVALLHEGAAPALITSRVRYRGRTVTATSDPDQARLILLGPDSVRWLVVDSVSTTRDEAVRVAVLAQREQFGHLIVVTSPMHTRRACAAFRRTGLTITCVAAPSRQVAVRSLANPGDRVAAFGPWLHETIGWWWYARRGWV